MLLSGLIVISLALTCTMFATRKAMLGFPCAMFWAITGAQSYTQSVAPWGDIYFYLFFASAFGMVVFTMLAAFGLREKRDTLADDSMDEEGKGDKFFDEEEPKLSRRTKELRERAEQRKRRL